jgi:hypothetical protein
LPRSSFSIFIGFIQMITNEKIRAIQRLLKRGVPLGEIIEDLKKEGHSAEEIDEVLNHSSGNSANNDSDSSHEYAGWYATSIGFLILGIALLLGPHLWLSRYSIFFLVLGIIGVVVRAILKGQTKN